MFSLILCSLFGLCVDGLTAGAICSATNHPRILWLKCFVTTLRETGSLFSPWPVSASPPPPPSQSDTSEVVARGVIVRSPHSAPPRHSLPSGFPGLGGVLFSVVFVVLRNKPKASCMHQADILPLGQIRNPPTPRILRCGSRKECYRKAKVKATRPPRIVRRHTSSAVFCCTVPMIVTPVNLTVILYKAGPSGLQPRVSFVSGRGPAF